jgi:hypothetical protein
MELTLTTPALLFPAIAILMLGYINRYIGTTTVFETSKKIMMLGMFIMI